MTTKTINFDKTLAEFVKATSNSMKAALACSTYAILHFEEHGQLGPAQQFLDAMPKNYSRRAAFLKWMAAHTPITMEKGKIVKDKGPNAVKFDTKTALLSSFWDFAPDMEIISFTNESLLKALQGVVSRFSKDKYTPANDDAEKALQRASTAIKALSRVA